MLRWKRNKIEDYYYAHGTKFDLIYEIFRNNDRTRGWSAKMQIWDKELSCYVYDSLYIQGETLKGLKNIFECIDKNIG